MTEEKGLHMISGPSTFPQYFGLCLVESIDSGPTDIEGWLCKRLVRLGSLLFTHCSLDSSEGTESLSFRLAAILALTPPLCEPHSSPVLGTQAAELNAQGHL